MAEEMMKKLSTALHGAVLFSSILSSAMTPALALGGCGANYHRGPHGGCVWGGQNEDYCVRKTGHPATRMPNGEMVCR
jgi:hypothetical protein